MRYLTLVLLLAICSGVVAEDTDTKVEEKKDTSSAEVASETTEDATSPEMEKLHADFGSLMKKSALVGTFTIDGMDQRKENPERYEISKVVKQAQGDYWNFFARIQYAKYDVTLPIPVEVKWAGTSPVITVDNLTIPGMGTFDARVLISDNKYAGTWRHGKVGGLMYGRIEKQEAADEVKKEDDKKENESGDKGTN